MEATPFFESDATQVLLRQIQARLKARSETVATAESCTGGLVATLLTELSGSSDYYLGGVSAYANSVKVELLGVSSEDLTQFGAVSPQVARAMAAGARDRLGATYGVALTGIAGPSGGTAGKPVGTVYCGIASQAGEESYLLNFSGDRATIRRAAAGSALELLARQIGIENP